MVWKEAVISEIEIVSRDLRNTTTVLRIVDHSDEIKIRHFPNKRRRRYCYIDSFGVIRYLYAVEWLKDYQRQRRIGFIYLGHGMSLRLEGPQEKKDKNGRQTGLSHDRRESVFETSEF
jgi:hypothetical protein